MGTFIKSLIALIFALGLSWIVCCGFIKLITLCFGIGFTWSVATGIWLCCAFIKIFLSLQIKISKD